MAPTTRVIHGPADVASVRTTIERKYYARLCRFPGFKRLQLDAGTADTGAHQRIRDATSIRLTKAMAPRLFALIDRVCVSFGLEERRLAVFQVAGVANASMYDDDDTIVLGFEGRLLADLDDTALLAVIGHELGHFVAHGPRAPITYVLRSRSDYMFIELSDEQDHDFTRLLAGLNMARELTADRFALLACRDLDAALRANMVLTAGLPASAINWDTSGYLEQCRGLMQATKRTKETIYGESHPEHAMRAYALYLFSESECYRELAGIGSGTRSHKTIDRELRRLIGMPKPSSPLPQVYSRPRAQGGSNESILDEYDPVPLDLKNVASELQEGVAGLGRRGARLIGGALASVRTGGLRGAIGHARRKFGQVVGESQAQRPPSPPSKDSVPVTDYDDSDISALEACFAELEARERDKEN